MYADAILAADIHIRKDKPISRVDNFHNAMWDKWEEIIQLSIDNNNCPILIAGDLGHRPEWPDWLLKEFIEISREVWENIYVIPGQHDLPNHKIDLIERSALGVLGAADIVRVIGDNGITRIINGKKQIEIYPFPWGYPICSKKINKRRYNIAISHQLVMKDNVPDFKINKFSPAKQLLKDFPEYDLILTGDNHIPFVVEYEGRLLVNPGSMMRSTAAQIDHRPRVYLWYAEENKVKLHYLYIEEDVLTREHIEEQKKREDRMKPFLDSIKKGCEIKLSFETNMENYLAENKQSENIIDKIWECVK